MNSHHGELLKQCKTIESLRRRYNMAFFSVLCHPEASVTEHESNTVSVEYAKIETTLSRNFVPSCVVFSFASVRSSAAQPASDSHRQWSPVMERAVAVAGRVIQERIDGEGYAVLGGMGSKGLA